MTSSLEAFYIPKKYSHLQAGTRVILHFLIPVVKEGGETGASKRTNQPTHLQEGGELFTWTDTLAMTLWSFSLRKKWTVISMSEQLKQFRNGKNSLPSSAASRTKSTQFDGFLLTLEDLSIQFN